MALFILTLSISSPSMGEKPRTIRVPILSKRISFRISTPVPFPRPDEFEPPTMQVEFLHRSVNVFMPNNHSRVGEPFYRFELMTVRKRRKDDRYKHDTSLYLPPAL